MMVGALAFVVITWENGGVGAIMAELGRQNPELLTLGEGRAAILRSLSFLLLPAAAGAVSARPCWMR